MDGGPRRVVAWLLLPLYGLVYAGCYWLSVTFGLVRNGQGESVAVLWLPSGLQAAALLVCRDRRLWPLLLGVGMAAELFTGWRMFGPLNDVAFIAALGNAGEAALFATITRWLGRTDVPTLHRSREVVALGVGAVAATAVNAAVLSEWVVFRAYWIGDLTGIVALAPIAISLAAEIRDLRAGTPVLRCSAYEVLAFAVVTSAAVVFIFSRSDLSTADASLVAALWPLLAWPAFRIGPTTTAGASLFVIVVADLYTRAGLGPFGSVAESGSSRVAALQGFLCILSLSSASLAAGLLEREQATSALAAASDIDPVTGLSTLEAARRGLARPRPGGSLTAVLVVDLDGFTDVNERYGREAGDELLRQVGKRFRVPLRTEDVVARMSGDTFVVVVGRLGGSQSAEVTAERVLATLTPPFLIGGHVIALSACSGLALMEPRESADRVLARALAAVTQAKQRGAGRSVSLDAEAYGRLDDARRLQSELARAISADELVLHYQPIVDVRDGRLVAVESLLRWQHPERGLLTAGTFIPGAEVSGLVVAIDDWVLAAGLGDLKRFRRVSGLDELTLFVNISARTLSEPDASDRIRHALHAKGVSPTSVVVEVTETALGDDSETGRRAAAELAGAGVTLAIDDFGQGHASLARLRALPISVIKIDHSFVSGLGKHEVDDALVGWVTRLAHELRMSTVAEGVESVDQLAWLATIGVDFAQGYGVAPPLPFDDVVARVAEDGRLGLSPLDAATRPRG